MNRFILVFILLSGFALASDHRYAPPFRCDALLSAASSNVDARQLEAAISGQITEVHEFRALREICGRIGVRCWLFGGTAAGFGHYVKWDLAQKSGDSRYQPDRFDYDFTNIYRSTQDADLVIDGTESQAAEVESELRNRFPHFQGNKSAWEVRLLRATRGDKETLLDNADFLNQHTDSNSTGMIEVTLPPQGEPVVRDLRDWQAHAAGRAPEFFSDILRGKLHFYYSASHMQTSRARRGLNPPIFSAVRYLTKAFQYELEILPEDWARIREIVDAFDPSTDLRDSYASSWMLKNAKKIVWHAVNLEYAYAVLDQAGLRRKLIEWERKTDVQDSMSWWLNREPLKSSPLGQGDGKTARQLGIDIVAHETVDFLAYESITRSHTGSPNLLTSRVNSTGESAYFGKGFYTAQGIQGARGTKITIRFRVHQDAREGSDFFLGRHSNQEKPFVVVTNKNALRVIPESLNLGPIEYFELLAEGGVKKDDRGLIHKLNQRIRNRIHSLSEPEAEALLKWIDSELGWRGSSSAVIPEFLVLTRSSTSPKIREARDRIALDYVKRWFFRVEEQPRAEEIRELLEKVELPATPDGLAYKAKLVHAVFFHLEDSPGAVHQLAESIVLLMRDDPETREKIETILRRWVRRASRGSRTFEAIEDAGFKERIMDVIRIAKFDRPEYEEFLLDEAMNAADHHTRATAIDALVDFPPHGSKHAYEICLRAIRQGSDYEVSVAIEGLDQLGRLDDEALLAMLRVIRNDEEEFGSVTEFGSPVSIAAKAMGRKNIQDPRIIDQLIAMLGERESQFAAALALEGSKNPTVGRKLLAEVRQPRSFGAKHWALSAIRESGRGNPEIFDALAKLYNPYEDSKVENQFLHAVISVGSGNTKLRTFLDGVLVRGRLVSRITAASELLAQDPTHPGAFYILLGVEEIYWKRDLLLWDDIARALSFSHELLESYVERSLDGEIKAVMDKIVASEAMKENPVAEMAMAKAHFLKQWKRKPGWIQRMYDAFVDR